MAGGEGSTSIREGRKVLVGAFFTGLLAIFLVVDLFVFFINVLYFVCEELHTIIISRNGEMSRAIILFTLGSAKSRKNGQGTI
jgi:hypothetical protein